MARPPSGRQPEPLRTRPPVPPPPRPRDLPPSGRSRGDDPRADRARPPVVRRRPGRLRRFVRRYGWRAYAIPLLAVATVLTLVDVVGAPDTTPAASTGAATSQGTPAEAPVSTGPAPAPATPTAPAEGDAGPTDVVPPPAAATYVEQGSGEVAVVPGSSGVYGSGPLQRFVVEVEGGIGVDGPTFAAAVEATLGDPRSWGSGGRMSFQRVDTTDVGSYDFRVSLVSPGSMERYCPGVGTGGYTSCRYGERAVINLARWETAVPDYQGDIATYRQYVVNHEVGHALGNGHQPCPGQGQLAPVMQQQTLGLEGCTKNAWPFP
ncbi:DUF3152 domain-containing protein [Geodermatophilus sp. SYSU D01106]